MINIRKSTQLDYKDKSDCIARFHAFQQLSKSVNTNQNTINPNLLNVNLSVMAEWMKQKKFEKKNMCTCRCAP